MLKAKPFFGDDVDEVWNLYSVKTLSPGVQDHKPWLEITQLSAGSEAHGCNKV